MAEKRLSRWSRLKTKGGADAREEALVEAEKKLEETQKAKPADEFAKLPGGVRKRSSVPAMAPLAPDAEDDDDRFTRGIGHAEPDPEGDAEAVMPAEPPLADGESEDDLFAGIDEEELTEEEREIVAGLPPLDQLTEESDFTPFLRDGVPEFLKRRALRLLWRLNPFFNFRDGLNDYDEDFNVVHRIIDELTGNYQVGRGHLSEAELRDMTPESARRAFDDPDDEAGDENAEEGRKDAPEADSEVPDKARENAKNAEYETAEDDDDVGDGEDDPDL